MIAQNIEQIILEAVTSRIAVQAVGDGSYSVDIPLLFPDGDQCRVFVTPSDGSKWDVHDGGSSIMRASYASSVDVTSPGYSDRLRKIMAMHGLNEDHGEVSRLATSDLGDAVFSMAQAAIDIVQLAKTPKAKTPEKTANFRTALSRIVTRAVGSKLVSSDWYNESADPEKRYPVTFRIEAPTKPLFVFGADSRTTCMHATMSCLFHKMKQSSFTAIAVYESEAAIAKKESERLDALVDRHFRSIEDREEIEAFISEAT